MLAPGGRVVLTCWEPRDPADERLPHRIRTVDLRAGLTAVGFEGVDVVERPDWLAVEHPMWAEAVALDPGDDAAMQAFRAEGVKVLEVGPLIRRVMATATAP